ncbi:hypothetical protein [Thalassolituus sp.]|uniref:hypothetical protein n=1 Tax=Thalassolituus sp. TaxID=2030822 RepID=UPI003518C3AB
MSCFRFISAAMLVLLLSLSSGAAEVDQFFGIESTRLTDATPALDREVRSRLKRALKRANRNEPHLKPRKVQRVPKQSHCSVPRLYDSVELLLARPIVGQLESFAEKSPDISRVRVALSDSVYRDFTWPQSPSLVLSERVASVIRVGDTLIGTDKLGHFFTEGFSYFDETRYLDRPVDDALLFGEWTESVYFGAQTTGVYSYADLVANFNGLRFWNRLLVHHPDPLTKKLPEPYIRCENDDWVLAAPFTLAGYVDPAWNESVNCSSFRTLRLLESVLNYGQACRAEFLPWDKYDAFAARLFNTAGPGIMPDYLQPEVILRQRNPDFATNRVMRWIRDFREGLERWRLRRELSGDKAP